VIVQGATSFEEYPAAGSGQGFSLGSRPIGALRRFCALIAYNRSCAYDPAWASPLAPPGNVMGVELWAGELYQPAGEVAASS